MLNKLNLITVIMPVYEQETFMPRAMASLFKQHHDNWELIIINDGSAANLVEKTLPDPRITHLVNQKNEGLGFSLNRALDLARGKYIAYLPADDIIYPEHLSSLVNALETNTSAILAYSGLKYHYNRMNEGIFENRLQLVQVIHRQTAYRWTERNELESDDLDKLFWSKLKGERVGTKLISCEWVDHPWQRHKIMQEPLGGINLFRQYYKVSTPIRFHSTRGHLMDEISRYHIFRKKRFPENNNPLKILIVGELAYNPERILTLAEKGHQLYGLWMRNPYWYNYVGPLPFGFVKDLNAENYIQEIIQLKPDIIYGCLNWQAVPFVLKVVSKFPLIPFCWHFKEGPFICIEKGIWPELVKLYERANGRIYSNEEMKTWFDSFLSSSDNPDLILDGDLPKSDWFNSKRSPLLSSKTGAIHTVVPGRPIGLHPSDVAMLASQNIHLHFYGEFTHGQWKTWIEKTLTMAPEQLHIHPNVNQEEWVQEFSQYDAGWLHFFKSNNKGNITEANWDDLNIPARMATLALAGLPMIQANNDGHIVATQTLARKLGLGIFPREISDLESIAREPGYLEKIRHQVWRQRGEFLFDTHVDRLLDYFNLIISNSKTPVPLRYKAQVNKLQ